MKFLLKFMPLFLLLSCADKQTINIRGEAKRKVNYTYNEKGKLVQEKVDELFAYSSAMPYVVKYEY